MPAVHLFWCTAVLAYLHEAGIRFSYFMAPAADWGHHLLPPKKINAKGEQNEHSINNRRK